MKKVFVFLVLTICFAYYCNAQLSVSFFSTKTCNKVAVGFEFSDRIWSDLRINGDKKMNDITIEPVIAYNFISKLEHDVYLGAGYKINYLNGPIFPLGVRIRPFGQNKSFNIHLELEPHYDLNSEQVNLNCSFGIKYIFKGDK